jgi:excisionase family DNA binding protein
VTSDPSFRRSNREPTGDLGSRQPRASLPRLAFGSPEEAAASIGVGRTFFYEEIMPELRVVRRGRKRIIPFAELERWLDRNASAVLG